MLLERFEVRDAIGIFFLLINGGFDKDKGLDHVSLTVGFESCRLREVSRIKLISVLTG